MPVQPSDELVRPTAMDKELEGQVAIVTGSGRGIGLGIVSSLAHYGAAVVVNDVDPERAQAAAAGLRESGHDVIAVTADVTAEADVERMVRTAKERFGRVDILVNNAGVLVVKAFLEHSLAEWRRVLDTNLTGAFLCCQRVLPHMVEQGSGNIVNISSIAAFHYTAKHVGYSASKAGLVALTRELAYEFGPRGIRVNAIAPGPIATNMTQEEVSADLQTALVRAIRVGRWGTPDDIGEAVVFLCSARAAYITGTTLVVAGGSDLKVMRT